MNIDWINNELFNKSALSRALELTPQAFAAKKKGTFDNDKKSSNRNEFTKEDLIQIEKLRKKLIKLLSQEEVKTSQIININFK